MHKLRFVLVLLAPALGMMTLACGGGDSGNQPDATSTPKPIPSPVVVAQEPALSYTRGDPSFDALPGATAHFGTLGGAVYQIEMPDDWNGRLVLFLHGSRSFEPELTVDAPFIRSYLVRKGYAWGASSYSSNVPTVADLAIVETAALWDHFVDEFGRPQYTYVTGQSLGGIASVDSAERYGDRYDGALPTCGALYSDSFVDFFVAGAFVAGVTQAEFDSQITGLLYRDRIKPALNDAQKYQQFQNIVVDLTGGPRPLAKLGVDVDINLYDMWTSSELAVSTRLFGNEDTVYALGPESGVSSEEFNAKAVRYAPGPLNKGFVEDILPTGELQIPTLVLNTTGETRVPLDAARDLQQRVDAAGKSDLLVQRTVREASHCGFTNAEWQHGLEDLVAWVEQGKKPKGEDVLNDKPTDLGKKFTLAPRMGLPEADEVPGAGSRVVVSGTATLDGAPISQGLLTAIVRGPNQLSRRCELQFGYIQGGRYELPVASSAELAGCGEPGAKMFLVYDPFGEGFVSQKLVDWPGDGQPLTLDATFSAADVVGFGRPSTTMSGSITDKNGDPLPPGTLVQAFVGETLCGVSSLPYTGDTSFYYISVVGVEAVPACASGGMITFRLDGKPAEQTVPHDLSFHYLDLIAP